MKYFGDVWVLAEKAVFGSGQKARGASNRLRALGMIARKAQVSQARIAKRLGLNACTVSNIVRELKGMGCVRDGGEIETDRSGPRERDLELVPDYAWSIGLGFSASKFKAVAVNMAGEIFDEKDIPMTMPLEDIAREMAAYRHALIVSHRLWPERFSGVGISIPGVVNASSGIVLLSSLMGLRNYPIREIFEQHIGCPVWVNREVTSAAYAEHYVGVTREHKSFIYFSSTANRGGGSSLGLSVVIDEKLFPGNHWGAGEINFLALGQMPELNHSLSAERKLAEGLMDAECRRYIDIIVILVNVLDISCFVLSVDEDRLSAEQIRLIRAEASQRLTPIPGRSLELLRSTTRTETQARGGALIAIHNSIAASLYADNVTLPVREERGSRRPRRAARE